MDGLECQYLFSLVTSETLQEQAYSGVRQLTKYNN